MTKSSKNKHRVQFQVYKDSVTKFFSVKENWDTIYPYLTGKFSRRFLEHFITEYARYFRCEYYLTDPATKENYLFNVYHSAQSVLLGVHKRHMDPFSRKNSSAQNDGFFEFGYGDKRCQVNVCELIFFRWALKRKVLDYAETHQEAIKDDMARLQRMKRNILGKRKQQEVQEIIIEIPTEDTSHPLKDDYWKDATKYKKQKPRRQRKRYRRSAVSTVFNQNIQELDTFTAATDEEIK